MRFLPLLALALSFTLAAAAQAPASKSEADLKAEYEQAQKFYTASNFTAALPLFEDLHAQDPQNPAYEERLAMSLLGSANNQGPAHKAARARAKSLLLEAQKLGDNSPLLVTVLEKLNNADAEGDGPSEPDTPARTDFAQAEKLFGSGDMKGALELYKKALSEEPNFYAAALYAGDSLFKTGDCPQAGLYYAKAIAINPDEETAHRYWADCLAKSKEMKLAEDQYIQAVIAQPYQKTPRQSLKTWADLNHSRIVPPPITLPNAANKGKDGAITITLDASEKDTAVSSLALMYSMNSALWQGEKFKKAYPNEKQYRHSLAEEVDNIRGMLKVAKEMKISDSKLSSSNKFLRDIDQDGMLECWILLDNPDQGIAQDYATYRKDHRDLMAQYIAKYDVHPM